MRPTERMEKLVEGLMKIEEPGHSIKQAMTDAGYCATQAKQGWAGVPKKVIQMLAKKGARLVEFGSIDAATQEKLVRGRLVYNTLRGTDKGVLSAKALGSDRRVAMFAPESQVGIVVISAPAAMLEKKAELLAPDSED